MFKTVEDLRLCNLAFLKVSPQVTRTLHEKSGEPDKKAICRGMGTKRPEGKGWCVSGEKTSALRGGGLIILSEEAAGKDGCRLRNASVRAAFHSRRIFSAVPSADTSVRLFHG